MIAAAAAPERPNPGVSLTIINGNWGATSLRAIRAVLESARDVMAEAFGRPPDAPVRVSPWNGAGSLMVHDKRPYEILLTARDRYWSRYVYQFSYRLCYVMARFDLYKAHGHKWFEGSLCELASLFVLHRLARIWAERPFPDVAGAAGFAPNHRSYAEERAQRYERPANLPEWLGKNVDSLQADPSRHDLAGVVALALLNRFLEDPSLWSECAWLNRWDPEADETFRDYLDSWTARLRASGREGRTPAMVKETFGL